jgi:hypothetical protein
MSHPVAAGSFQKETRGDSKNPGSRIHRDEEHPMKKNRTRLQITPLEETQKRLGERELSEVELKNVAGGLASEGGTCTTCNDSDC